MSWQSEAQCAWGPEERGTLGWQLTRTISLPLTICTSFLCLFPPLESGRVTVLSSQPPPARPDKGISSRNHSRGGPSSAPPCGRCQVVRSADPPELCCAPPAGGPTGMALCRWPTEVILRGPGRQAPSPLQTESTWLLTSPRGGWGGKWSACAWQKGRRLAEPCPLRRGGTTGLSALLLKGGRNDSPVSTSERALYTACCGHLPCSCWVNLSPL